MPANDEWNQLGEWIVSGGVRVCFSQDPDELVLRYQERDFFTQVRLPMEKLRELLEPYGWLLRPLPPPEANDAQG